MAKKSSKSGRSSEKEEKKSRARALGARPIWTGNLRLALVSVPVQLFPATQSGARVSFHQVHQPSGKRIRYEKVVPGIGAVESDEIVKGYDLGDGNYVLLEPEEVDSLKLESRRTLDLVQFVDAGEIDPIWFDRPYYVAVDGELAEEAYGVLRDALRASGRIGLGQFVMRGREYIGALKPCGNGMLLETLRFADEVREAAPFFAATEEVQTDKELLELAGALIERKTAPFEPERFHDSYTEAVRQLIEAKRKRKKPARISEGEPAGGAKVIDLVDALKRSVRSAEGGGSGRKRKAG